MNMIKARVADEVIEAMSPSLSGLIGDKMEARMEWNVEISQFETPNGEKFSSALPSLPPRNRRDTYRVVASLTRYHQW